MILGENFIVKLGSNVVAASKSCEIEVSCKTIEATSASDGDWERHITDLKSWSVNVSWLVASNAAVNSKLLAVGTTYTLSFTKKGTNATDYVQGSAILKTCKVTATRGNLLNGTFQFLGAGPLS